MRLRKIALLALCAAVMTAAGGTLAQPAPLTDLTFFLTFVPNVQFSPLYVAIEKGYFAEEGLNVIIQHGSEPDGVDLIAAGSLDFGMISGEQVILARANGRPVVYVHEWFQQYPVGIIVPDNSGVASVPDLAGRKVGIPGRYGASYTGLVALLAANDMTEGDITLDPIDFSAPNVMCLGAIDAAVVYLNNEPLQIQQRADAGNCGSITGLTLFPVAEAADMVSNGIVTSEKTIAEQPELVRAVVRAFDRGLHDVINNPAEAYLLSQAYVENLPAEAAFMAALQQAADAVPPPDREAAAALRTVLRADLEARFMPADTVQFLVLLSSIDLWDAERTGFSELSSWEITQDTLWAMAFLPRLIDLTAAFTNDFLPPVE
jgi:NitT/TauT family transport system substrate-binding protein